MSSLAILSAWLIFRLQIIYERKRLFNIINSFLNTTRYWFSTSYSEKVKDENWFHPGKTVKKVELGVLINLLNSNLIDTDFASKLTYLAQSIQGFNASVELFINYRFSDIELYRKAHEFHKLNLVGKDYVGCCNEIEKLNNGSEDDKKLAFYLKQLYNLQESIHVRSIGDMKFHTDSNFPLLNKNFIETEHALKNELNKKYGILNDKARYVFGDMVFIIIPLIAIAYNILKILNF